MTFEITDLAGISQPIRKLIAVVSEGIGAVYRPRSIRKDADAKAYEMRVIAAAGADVEVIKASGVVRAELERINALSGLDPEFLERAKMRLLTRELEGQVNIEAIAQQAIAQLPSQVSDQPVSGDWRRKFFQEAENICDADLQLLWGKVLAGEVSSPGSYSLRTLEVLKHISKEEAELFRIACNLAFQDGWIMKPHSDPSVGLDPYRLDYNALLSLRDAGLVFEGDTLVRSFTGLLPDGPLVLSNNGIKIHLTGPKLGSFQFSSIPFTRAGRELQNLIDPSPCIPYLQDVAKKLRHRGLTVKKAITTTPQPGVEVTTCDEDF